MYLTAEVSPGELIDKLSILNIKLTLIKDEAKLANVRHEHTILNDKFTNLQIAVGSDIREQLLKLSKDLETINCALWDIEDNIRDCERNQDFGPKFIELARGVYKTNDKRSAVKRDINELLQSELIEEKSYKPY